MKDIERLALEWVENDARDPYSGGYIGTIIDGLLNRLVIFRMHEEQFHAPCAHAPLVGTPDQHFYQSEKGETK